MWWEGRSSQKELLLWGRGLFAFPPEPQVLFYSAVIHLHSGNVCSHLSSSLKPACSGKRNPTLHPDKLYVNTSLMTTVAIAVPFSFKRSHGNIMKLHHSVQVFLCFHRRWLSSNPTRTKHISSKSHITGMNWLNSRTQDQCTFEFSG